MPEHSSFVNSILNYDPSGPYQTAWARGLHSCLVAQNFDQVPFLTPQLLEPSVLYEVIRQTGINSEKLEKFEYDVHGPALNIKWLLDCIEWAPPVQRLNLATCLAASCRYSLAKDVLAKVRKDALHPVERVSYYIAEFVIENRLENGTSHNLAFAALKELIEEHTLPESRVLEVATQAIVWRMKNQSVETPLFNWFVSQGDAVAKRLGAGQTFRDRICLSAYHRAFAMIPAAGMDKGETRRHMQLAEDFALSAEPSSKMAEHSAFDARKTVLESSLKECLHVSNDLDRAFEVGQQLVAMDPNWSLSYHELAEVYLKVGDFESALDLYQSSMTVGLPRLAFSQYMVGVCLAELQRDADAIAAFHQTLSLDPSNISAGISGFQVAQRSSHGDAITFHDLLDGWNKEGLLTEDHRELLK